MSNSINPFVKKSAYGLFPFGATLSEAIVNASNDANKNSNNSNVGGATPTVKIRTPFDEKLKARLKETQAPKLNHNIANLRQFVNDARYISGGMSDKEYYANSLFNSTQVIPMGTGANKKPIIKGNKIITPLTPEAQEKQIDKLYDTVTDRDNTTNEIVVNYIPEQLGGGNTDYVDKSQAGFDWKLAGLIGGAALIVGLLFGGKR